MAQPTDSPLLQSPSSTVLKGTPVVKIGDEDLEGLNEKESLNVPVEILHLGLTGVRGSPWFSPENDNVSDSVSNSLAPENNREDSARSFSPTVLVVKNTIKSNTTKTNVTANLTPSVILLNSKPSTNVNSSNTEYSSATNSDLSSPQRPDTARSSSIRPRHTPNWLPSVDLSPPPIQPVQSWDQWRNSGTSGSGRSLSNTSGDLSPNFQHKTSQSAPVPVMVQLLPPRLAALLTQAEEYAKLTFSHTITPPKPMSLPSAVAASSAPQTFLIHAARLTSLPYSPTANEDSKRRPKYFPPLTTAEVIPLHPRSATTFYRRGIERSSSSVSSSVYQPRADVNVGGSLHFPAQVVPEANKYQSRYIPLRTYQRMAFVEGVHMQPETEIPEHYLDISATYNVSVR